MIIKSQKIISSKRFIFISLIMFIALFSVALNIAFGSFTNRSENVAAHIKVKNMTYEITINGSPGTIITVSNNNIIKSNIVIKSLNNFDSKYELIYDICLDQDCNNIIEKPKDLLIEYSSKTIDEISGAIVSGGTKQLRIITTNNTENIYYIKLSINTGFIYNTLALKNLITTSYNEEDIIIAAIIDGVVSTTFPTIKGEYETSVACQTDNGVSNATGTAIWNGSKWVANISEVDTGRMICNVEFFIPLKSLIIEQDGGESAIALKGSPDFSKIATTIDTGLYAYDDDYGISYYYRGLKNELKNNLISGGFQWKIIRLNGDSSVRLIYNGTEEQFNDSGTVNDIGVNTQISGTHAWNLTNYTDAKYIGYMYGGANGIASTQRHGTISAAATYNETSTNMKNVLENWYQDNIVGKAIESQIVDNLFCNDRQLRSEVGGASTGPGYGASDIETNYAPYFRLYQTINPDLKCGVKNDRFTKSDTIIGNGALTHPIGLINGDELLMAGTRYILTNTGNYLYTNQSIWTFSPLYLNSNNNARMLYMATSGGLAYSNVNSANAVRPVVSINGNIKVTGDGSNTNPFKTTF